MSINFRPAEQEGRGGEGCGGGSPNHTALFRAEKVIKSNQKVLIQHHKAIEDI